MRRRSVRRCSGDGDEEPSSASESRNMLTIPVDDHDNSTDCEEWFDDGEVRRQKRGSQNFLFSESEDDGECLTDVELSSEEENGKGDPSTSSVEPSAPRRSRREISLYIQRVLGRPLRAIHCFKEREQGGTVVQTELADEEELTDDENSCPNEASAQRPEEEEHGSDVSDIDASDLEEDQDGVIHGSNPVNPSNHDDHFIDNYLQGHFARLSSTDRPGRARSNSEIDEGQLPPGIVVSNCELNEGGHPVTEEETLSEREGPQKPSLRNKRRTTRSQYTKQSNYLTASLPALETDSESECDGRQLIRSALYQNQPLSPSDLAQSGQSSPEIHAPLSNFPSTDSESFELEDEDDSGHVGLYQSPFSKDDTEAKSVPSVPVDIVSQTSVSDGMNE